jgi:hypothetical protein
MRTALLEVSLWTAGEPSRLVGIFEDVLPSPAALAAMGLAVRDDYDPDTLRSCELDDDPDGV